MEIICLDFEGVLSPEIWIGLANVTGIEELSLTTRDIPNYNDLMDKRIKILQDNNITASALFEVANNLEPMRGAKEFLDSIRCHYQVIILSDTFYDLAKPIFAKLSWPTVFCHTLERDKHDRLVKYKIRVDDHKKKAIENFKKLNFKTIAVGDSYNDLSMLYESDYGILFKSPQSIRDSNEQFFSCDNYNELKNKIDSTIDGWKEL